MTTRDGRPALKVIDIPSMDFETEAPASMIDNSGMVISKQPQLYPPLHSGVKHNAMMMPAATQKKEWEQDILGCCQRPGICKD